MNYNILGKIIHTIIKLGCKKYMESYKLTYLCFNPQIYGGCFSEDKCWYRCKVVKVINNEKCRVLYIDYGNSEVLRRSEIVEISENLQFPGVATKYKLWGLQISANIDLNQFDRGRLFLNSLVFEKEMKITHKIVYRDGTIVARAECGLLDVGEEMVKKGFVELRTSPIKNKSLNAKMDFFLHKNVKSSTPRWKMNSKMTESFGDMFLSEKNENTCKESLDCMENRLLTYVGTTMKKLAISFEKLKEMRYASRNFGSSCGCKLRSTYISTEEDLNCVFSSAQDEIQSLILQRNELQHKLYKAVEEFIVEVDDLPLFERLETLKKLQGSLEVAYGQTNEAENSEAFEEFFEWKNARLEKFSRIRKVTDTSLQNLVLNFSKIIQELDEKDKKIILNMYSMIMRKILQEQDLINKVNQKYLESCEFRNQIVKWLDVTPNIDDLLLIKKRVKNIKAQLRWKLVEKNNLEESDNYSKSEMVKISEEISVLQNNMFQEIYNEQEEYVSIHISIFTTSHFLKSGSLIVSLEHNLLNAEPVKELSIKHPIMCSTVQEQKFLLKGYIADTNTETQIIERAVKYHQVWKELKEESCLMQPVFLFLCKSEPIMYLMIPYYAGANLGTLQMTAPLIVQETLKVMKGVARGLCVLHKADIIHGSLHKNNVFALNREQGIVGDFDFTKSESEHALSASMTLNGLNLISPELRKGQPPSPASDMYAFGCLLYWLFIGKQEIKTNRDGTPQIDGLDDKIKSLLSQLLCYDNRMTAEQVLNADCFLSPELISVPLESEGTDYDHGEQRSEKDLYDC
uniref:Serine/threonine kinase 31 n=1 Tax=Pseudonaja textilis TaxID=8673 RepID=A0A670ZBJ9_PSETE